MKEWRKKASINVLGRILTNKICLVEKCYKNSLASSKLAKGI